MLKIGLPNSVSQIIMIIMSFSNILLNNLAVGYGDFVISAYGVAGKVINMESLLRIVIFQIGTGFFGVDIRKVIGIVKGIDITETSDECPLNITGMLNLHGNAVPILNLYEKFRTKLLISEHTYFIIISLGNKLLALPGDR